MGILISIFNVSELYNKIIDFHKSIDGNWLTYLYVLYKYYANKSASKGRFDLYDIDIDGNPYAFGLLEPKEEWIYECPQKNRSENILIYGTNSLGQYLVIDIQWRPQTNCQIKANVRLIFKDENGLIYELNEKDLLKTKSNEKSKQYRIAGLTVQVLSPLRKYRIRFRGYLNRKDSNELVFSNFRLFWSPLSNVFDFQNDFDNKFVAKELSALGVNQLKAEERHEQWGQITGSVQFDDQKSKEVFLWGNKSKQFLNNNNNIRKVTRIYGFSHKCFAFHVGAVRSDYNYRLRYGYVSLGNGTVYSMSNISSGFKELESIGSSLTKFKIEIKQQKRAFLVEIEESTEKYDNLLICEMKLNGHKGKCIVVFEEFNENIVNIPNEELSTNSLDLVLPISDPKSENVALSGGKGASLAALSQMANNCETTFVVPKGLIVTTNSYNAIIEESDVLLDEIEKIEKVAWSESREGLRKCCEEVSDKFAKQKLPQNIRQEIKTNLLSNFGENFESIRFAVRSSAQSEDSDEMSSAGQMTTILGVKGIEEISEAVMKCWSSQFGFIAVEYKRGYGQPINNPMAVVIQEMVSCDSAGVVFTCDPISGDERYVLITANYGIGESVVSALAEPDTIRLSVNIEANSLLKKRTIKNIENIEIGSKLKSIVLNEDNKSGTIEMSSQNNNNCCLSDAESRALAEVCLEVHRFYGNPRDIEWGIKDNEIYLLQSRPLTSLDNWTDWEIMHEMDSGQQSEREYLSRANLGEVFPGASSHMCLSWIINVWNANGFRSWRKMLNLSKTEFSPYYNRGGGTVNNAYFFLLKTGMFPFIGDPKSTISKSIQIGIFGHEFNEGFEDLLKDSNEKAPKTTLSLFMKIYMTLGGIKYFLTPGTTLRQCKQELKDLDLFKGKKAFTAKDIFNIIAETSHLAAAVNYAHGKATMTSMVYNVVLLDILKKNNTDNESNSYSDFSQLVSSANQVVSAEVPNILRQIANSIENRQKFRQMSDERALKYLLNSETKASEMFKDFLLEYGHRGYKEFDPLAPQWGENPLSVVKSIKIMLTGDQKLSQTKKNQSMDEIISSLKTPLSWRIKLLLKYLVIPWCQSGVSLREQSKHQFTWTYNHWRKAFWRLAKQMVSEGRLPEPQLMFHLTFNELKTLLNERDPTLIARARLRKKFLPIQESFKYPETSIGPNIKPRNENSDLIEIPNGEVVRIKGTPVSAGKVKGRCCVAMTLEEAQNIQSGDILITYSTDIGWSPYFPMLSGLTTEIGGLISHGAVIAREYGLPCLVGVENAHRLFKTGDIVVVDSEKGEIYKIIE